MQSLIRDGLNGINPDLLLAARLPVGEIREDAREMPGLLAQCFVAEQVDAQGIKEWMATMRGQQWIFSPLLCSNQRRKMGIHEKANPINNLQSECGQGRRAWAKSGNRREENRNIKSAKGIIIWRRNQMVTCKRRA